MNKKIVSATLALASLAATAPAHAGDDDRLTCSASALRAPGVEPVALDDGHCTTAAKALAGVNLGGGLLPLQVRVSALEAETGPVDGAARAAARASRATLKVLGVGIDATGLEASAQMVCADGAVRTTTGGGLASLTVNGRPVAVGAEPRSLSAGLVTIHLNHTQGGVRRALWVRSIAGDVVVGEARASAVGEPCRTEPDPDPEPRSEITQTVDAADGTPVHDRTAEPGAALTYRMTYRNSGDATAQDVTVADELTGQAATGCEPECTTVAGIVRFDLGDVPAGEQRNLLVRTTLPSTAASRGERTAIATARATDATGTTGPANAQARVDYQPRLSIVHEQRMTYGEASPTDWTTERQTFVLDGPGPVWQGNAIPAYRVGLRNDGTAPATGVVVTDRVADALTPEACGTLYDDCTIADDPGAPQVLEPGGTGKRLTSPTVTLPIGEEVDVYYSATFRRFDYAAPLTTVQTSPRVTWDGGAADVPGLITDAETPARFGTYVDVMGDLNRDGTYESHISEERPAPDGTPLRLEWSVNGSGSQATEDVVAAIALPAGITVDGDPCADAGNPCTYTPGDRTLRLTADRIGAQSDRTARAYVRATPGFAGNVSLTSLMTSTRATADYTESFRVS